MITLERHIRLIQSLLRHDSPVAPRDLSRALCVSERTLRSDIARLNRELAPFEGCIVAVKGEGYRLEAPSDQKHRLAEQLLAGDDGPALDSVGKRLDTLTLALLLRQGCCSSADLAACVYISQATLAGYVKELRQRLRERGLELRARPNMGYYVQGDELRIRSCALEILGKGPRRGALEFTSVQRLFCGDERLARVAGALTDFAVAEDVHFSDRGLDSMVLYTAISALRVGMGASLQGEPVLDDSSIEALSGLFRDLENRLAVSFNLAERSRIAARLIVGSSYLVDTLPGAEYPWMLVDRILAFIDGAYHVDLRSDETLRHNLAQHLQSTIAAQCLDVSVVNPLLRTIQTSYMLAYEMAETAIRSVMRDEPFALTPDDIGFVAMHLSAAIDRGSKTSEAGRLRIAVLYSESYAEGAFISTRLSVRYRDRVDVRHIVPTNELARLDLSDVDMLVSTAPLRQGAVGDPGSGIPASPRLVVLDIAHPDLAHREIDAALDRMGSAGAERIADFFDPRLFFCSMAAEKTEVIHGMCEVMRNAGLVDEAFEASVLEREGRVPTALDGVLALPHPLAANMDANKIAVGILKEPIAWSETKDAQLVLLLALSNDSEELTLLYDALITIMDDPESERRLIAAENLAEFLAVIEAAGAEG